GVGLVLVLVRPRAGPRIVGTGTQVDVDVVEVAHHVRVGAERRHDVLGRRRDVLAAADHHAAEVRVAHGLERVLERRRVGRAFAVGTVADVAFRVITAIARVGVPVDLAVLDLVGRVAGLVEILAVLVLHGRRRTGAVGETGARTCGKREGCDRGRT